MRAAGLVTTEPYLLEAAQLLSSRSCGGGWLLQPHINDMPDLEYRFALAKHTSQPPLDVSLSISILSVEAFISALSDFMRSW